MLDEPWGVLHCLLSFLWLTFQLVIKGANSICVTPLIPSSSFLGPPSGWLSSFPAQYIVLFHPQHVLQWTSSSHITAGWDEVSSPSGLESLLAKRKDSTVLAIFSTHSSHPFTELRLAGRRISRPKLLCSWTLLSGTGLYSSPQSITLSSQSSDWTELIVFLWNSDQCYIYCIWAKSHE